MPAQERSSAPTPEISVVVPTYNRSQLCTRLLQTLAKQSLAAERYEVIAVDNFSGDDTSVVLESLVAEVPYTLRPLRTSYNGGPAPARNMGWKNARAPIVAYVDDDCVPDTGWLEAGLAIMSSDEGLGIVQGRTEPAEPLDSEAIWSWKHSQEITGPSAYFEACNIFYRRAALEQTGGFNEDIGWWGEDTSAGWRVVESGWGRGYVDDAVVVHDMTSRGVGWFVRNGLLEGNMVRNAAMHPGFRQEGFWRPWAFRRDDAAFVAATAGAVLALRWKPAALAVLPYLYIARPPLRQRHFFRRGFERVIVDAARSAGQIAGGIRYRILVV